MKAPGIRENSDLSLLQSALPIVRKKVALSKLRCRSCTQAYIDMLSTVMMCCALVCFGFDVIFTFSSVNLDSWSLWKLRFTQIWFNLIGDMLGFKYWHLTNAFSASTQAGTRPSDPQAESLYQVSEDTDVYCDIPMTVCLPVWRTTQQRIKPIQLFSNNWETKSQMKKDYLKLRCCHLHVPDLALTWHVNLEQDLNFTISFTCSNQFLKLHKSRESSIVRQE